MSVKLRKKKTSKGLSLYLDIYQDGLRRYDFLHLYLKGDKAEQSRTLQMAQEIRKQVERDLILGKYSVANLVKLEADFYPLFDNYKKYEHYRVYRACREQLKKYSDKQVLPCRQINEIFCEDFKHHLNEKLNGETPFNYFKVFKRVLKDATRYGYFVTDPSVHVKNSNPTRNEIRKDVLTPEELQKLYITPCGNQEVKRAGLFSSQTGLRQVDINKLQWKDIFLEEKILKITQSKTGVQNVIPLNDAALQILSEIPTGRQKLFILPSTNGTNKSLRKWVEDAQIKNKKMSFYVFRHTFITGILLVTDNMKVASQLAGHTTTRTTERYIHLIDKVRRSAVDKLPGLMKVVKEDSNTDVG